MSTAVSLSEMPNFLNASEILRKDEKYQNIVSHFLTTYKQPFQFLGQINQEYKLTHVLH